MKKTFWNKFFPIDTPLGQYFAEKTSLGIFLKYVEDCQKNQNECELLVPYGIVEKANNQAKKILQKASLPFQESQEIEEKESSNNEEKNLQKVGGIFRVNTETEGYSTNPAITLFSNNSVLISWIRYSEPDGDDYDVIKGRLFKQDDASPQTNEFLIEKYDSFSTIVPFENNNFAIAIADGYPTTYFQLFNASRKIISRTLLDYNSQFITAKSINPNEAIFIWYKESTIGQIFYNLTC